MYDSPHKYKHKREIVGMKQKKLSELTDKELLEEAKKLKSASIMNAVLIGFLFGVIIYSILVSSIGLFTLIPLFLIFKLFNNSKNKTDLEQLIEERELK